MNYPDYERLYARYLQSGPEPLIKLVGDLTGKVVFDLCAGGGRLSEEVLKYHPAMVVAIDEDFDMVSYCVNGCRVINGGLPEALLETQHMIGALADVAFCQQAINYWLKDHAAKMLHGAMTPGGLFIFNTFNKKPSYTPQTKNYTFDGHDFTEVSWLLDQDTVYHVQIRSGLPPHANTFMWLSPERIFEVMSPFFEVESFVNGNTTLYRCTSK